MPCVTWLICIVQVNGILLLAVQKKKIIDKLIIAKDIIVEGSSKILILQKDSFFYHREGFKSGFLFIKKATP